MTPQNDFTTLIDRQYRAFREELLTLIREHYNPALSKRCSPEDILQETVAAMMRNPEFLTGYPDITPIDKWKKTLFHTLADLERRHLQTQKRSAEREISFVRVFDDPADCSRLDRCVDRAVSTPRSKAELQESADTLMKCISELSPEDRRIITLRQMERFTAEQCAEQLGISLNEVKAAHIRAIRHLRRKLSRYSGLLP